MCELKQKAIELSKQFGFHHRDKDDVIIVANTPLAKELAHGLHDKIFPNDWIYAMIQRCLEDISEDGEDAVIDPDVYNSDLFRWVIDYPYAMDYCNQAISEDFHSLGSAIERGNNRRHEPLMLVEYIMRGQAIAIEEIKQRCIAFLKRFPLSEIKKGIVPSAEH